MCKWTVANDGALLSFLAPLFAEVHRPAGSILIGPASVAVAQTG
jgi:hypothetical protein